MDNCHVLDLLVTPFIDGECTEEERAIVTVHIRECAECQRRVEAESTVRQLLHTHAAVARTMGAAPVWRPRVWRLGRPGLRMYSKALLLPAALAIGLLVLWFRPAQASATGVIGDSVCRHKHSRACTLACIKRGAAFVLITDKRVFQIRNRELPELADFADVRVKVTGTIDGETILIRSIAATDR